MEDTKQCTGCGEEQPMERFGVKRGKRQPQCKGCLALSKRESRKNKIKKLEEKCEPMKDNLEKMEFERNYYKEWNRLLIANMKKHGMSNDTMLPPSEKEMRLDWLLRFE